MDFIYPILLLLLAYGITTSMMKGHAPAERKWAWWILGMHILTTIGFYFVTRNGGGDAWGYWRAGSSLSGAHAYLLLFEAKGTYFMHAFNYPFAGLLGMGFFSNTCAYSLLGYTGMLYFYKLALRYTPVNPTYKGFKLLPLLFLIPMLHFWCSGIGKDTLLFWCIGMFAWGMGNVSQRMLLIGLSLLLAYLVRPHIALFLMVSFGLAFLMDNKVATWKRMILSAMMLGIGIAILPMVLEYAKVEEASVENFNEFAESKSAGLSRGHTGSSVDISSYPAPLKWFTFLFRPLFFDVNGVPALVASFENLFLLLLFFKAMSEKPFHHFKKAPFVIKGLVIFLAIGTFIFSTTMGNLGVMIRMRNMFLPGLLLFYLWVLSQKPYLRYLHRRKKADAKSKVSV